MPYDFKLILERLDFWIKQDDRIFKAYNDFTSAVSDSYPIIPNQTCTGAYLDAFPEPLQGELSYYAFEVPNLRGSARVERDGMEWDFKKRGEVLDYLNTYYNHP